MPQSLRKQITGILNRIYYGGMTTASGGNISFRDGEGTIWTTPGGTDKGLLTADDIVCIRADGTVLNGKGNSPTSELPSHLAIYREREDIHAVIHAHPPALVTYSIARKIPDTRTDPFTCEVCGEAGYAPYEISGSEELGQSIAEQFGKGHTCVIMENHAVVVGGKDLLQAFHRFEEFEHCAEAVIKANRLGNVRVLSDEQLTLYKDRWRSLLNKNEEGRFDTPETGKDEGHPIEDEKKNEVSNFVQRACSQRLISGASGSVSVRYSENGFLVTPGSSDRYQIRPEEIVPVENGKKNEGQVPDRLAPLHQQIFNAHPHVNCIAIARPPNIRAFCLAGRSFDTSTIPESYVFLRQIPLLPFESLCEDGHQIVSGISQETPLLLIENAGVIVTGRSVSETFHRLEVAEFSAKSLVDTNALGREVPLEKERLEELTRKFVR